MAEISQVKCRAQITIAGVTIDTPYVQSFNVKKQRGQVSSFDATLKVSAGEEFSAGDVIIRAGTKGNLKTIFKGICKQAKISPCFDDPNYYILSISGTDHLSLLEGKKYTRRCVTSDSSWAAITGVIRRAQKSGKLTPAIINSVNTDHGEPEKQNNLTGYTGTNAINNSKMANEPGNYHGKTPLIEITNVEGVAK